MSPKKLFQQISEVTMILFLVGCSTSATPVPPTATPLPATGGIEGTVTLEGNTNKPIANGDVDLLDESFNEIAKTKTDSQGRYSFTVVKPGKYILSAVVQGKCMSLDLGNPVTIAAGEVVKKDFSLPCTP